MALHAILIDRASSGMTGRNPVGKLLIDGPSDNGWREHQLSIPRLPLYPLHDTLERYLQYVEPLLTVEEFEQTKKVVADFESDPNQGPSLHAELVERDRQNPTKTYYQQFWDEMYLAGRYPIVINSNPAFSLHPDPNCTTQAQRAASVVHGCSKWHRAMCRGEITPMYSGKAKTPNCMAEFPSLFATTRIPLSGSDQMRKFPNARHVVVFRRDQIFKVDVLSEDGLLIPKKALQLQFQFIIDHASPSHMSQHDPPHDNLGVFTTLPREDWSRYRAQLAQLSPRNARSLGIIDSALFHVSLSDYTPRNRTEWINTLLTGCPKGVWPSKDDGYMWQPQWFDKTFMLTVTPAAEAGVSFEHSGYDGQTVAHMMNESWSDVQGLTSTVPAQEDAPLTDDQISKVIPAALGWDWSPALTTALAHAVSHFSTLVASNLTTALEFEHFGTDQIKKMGVSPDGFLQFSFQLAYARMHKAVSPRPPGSHTRFIAPFSVYESCSTKRWRYGRTEAIRSVTPESTDAMGLFLFENENRAALKKAIKTATAAHRARAQEAQMGRAVDRHLFSLYRIASRRAGQPVPALFSDKAWGALNLTQLSTSNVNGPGVEMIAFGAVCPPGYGVGYTVEKHKLILTVSNWTSMPDTGGGGFGGVKREEESDVEDLAIKTDSKAFVDVLRKTFLELSDLLSEPDAQAEAAPRSRL